jgi:hypothetical protein
MIHRPGSLCHAKADHEDLFVGHDLLFQSNTAPAIDIITITAGIGVYVDFMVGVVDVNVCVGVGLGIGVGVDPAFIITGTRMASRISIFPELAEY